MIYVYLWEETYVADGGGARIYGDTIEELIAKLMMWLEDRSDGAAIVYGTNASMSRRVKRLRERG